ncbi:TniQ family protein [Pikeienuella sp. HZG-20]|uniref:TniQ family protein n=1 Tax=Paludibacillus litoralis TaxID=3133267 RepID=UPI0030EE8520
MTLFPHLPFNPEETHLSIAARLAAFHTKGRVKPFLAYLGVPAHEFAAGKLDAITAFCARTGVDLDQVVRNTPISVDKARYTLRKESITADFLANPHTCFYPACLLADDAGNGDPALARHMPLEWTLRVARTCPKHGLPLIVRRRECWDDQFHELAVRVPETGAELRKLADQASPRPVSPMQAYAVSRLEGAAGPEWLDSQTLEQTVRVSELLGVLVEFGASRGVSDLTADEWDRAGRTGFGFSSRGESGVRDALHEIQSAFRGTGRLPQYRNVFGRLYEWLASPETATDAGDIRRILREHMFDTIELADGAALLGGKLPARRLHSVASLAKESGLHPKTLRHILVARNMISLESPHQVFDAGRGREVAASARNIVHVIALPKALNCSRPQADGLLGERILTPIAARPGAPGHRHKAVAAENVEKLLSDLAATARPVNETPPGMVPIGKAAEKVKAPCVDILHLILGGYLSHIFMLRSESGIAALRVDAREVGRKIGRVMIGLSPSAAASMMRLPARTVWAILDDDEYRAALPSTRVQGVNGRHEFRRIAPEAAERFRATYVTARRIANAMEVDIASVSKSLKRARVVPTFPAATIGVDLYLPDRLPPKFAPKSSAMAA